MITSAPARDKEDYKHIIMRLIQDTFGNQLVLGDLHAPMDEISDIYKVTRGKEIIGGWSVFHGFEVPTIAFPHLIPESWSAIKQMINLMEHEEIIVPYPIKSENDHGYRPWKQWPQYDWEHTNTDFAMRVTDKDVEVHDISELPEIRATTDDDLSALKEFYEHAKSTGEFEGFFHPLQLKSSNYVVCVDNGEIVATAGTHFETPYTMQIGNVFVKSEYRRRGIGRAVTTACVLGSIKTQRVPTLFVNEEKKGAIEMYENIGFEKYNEFAFYRGKLKK